MAVWIETGDRSLIQVDKTTAETSCFLNRNIKKGYGNTKERAIFVPVDNNLLNMIADFVRIGKTDQETNDKFTNNIHPHMLIRLALAAKRIELNELFDVVMGALARMDEITVVSQIAELNKEEKKELLKIQEDRRNVDDLTAYIEAEEKDGNQSGSSKSRNKRKKSKRAQKKKKELAEGGDNDQNIVNDHDDHDADSKGSRPSKSKLNNMKKKERKLSKKDNDSDTDRLVQALWRNLNLSTEKRLKDM